MKIISYNVNGIRAALKKGLREWIISENPDILCIQETKSQPDQVDDGIFKELGYQSAWHSAQKKGYSGVATYHKQSPKNNIIGIGVDTIDNEGRVLISEYDDFSVINCYFPSGSSSEDRHGVKMDFLRQIQPWIDNYKKQQANIILVGDYNIVHTEKDIHNPTRRDNPSGYRPEERAWMTEWFASGFTDAYRYLHPDEINFSWWSYRAGSRAKDKGWRIDYMSVSDPIKDKIKSCYHQKEAVHSDHCPVVLEIEI